MVRKFIVRVNINEYAVSEDLDDESEVKYWSEVAEVTEYESTSDMPETMDYYGGNEKTSVGESIESAITSCLIAKE